jgi:hypothetical protein
MTETDLELARDLLRGAEEIAEFMFGSRDFRFRRKIYHLAATSNLPVFKLGSMICARKSILIQRISDDEDRRSGNGRKKSA